jgi:SET family sugar efflux transporter-like MFS transporter
MVGARSDRTGQRLGFFRICAIAGFLGWLAFAFSSQLWMPFVLSATILAFAGASMSQLFAAIHDDIDANPSATGDSVFATIRMSVTAAWIIGPVIGTTVAGAFGTRAVILMTAACAVAQIVPLGTIRLSTSIPRPTRTGQAPISARASLASMKPLLIFTALCLSFSASEAVKHAFLPIYMANELHLSSTMQGLAIGIQPFVEFPLIPVAVVGARRFGAMRLIALATVVAMFANLWFAMADSAVDILIAQSLMGVVWGVFAALGILVAQRLLRTAVATASGIFMTSGAIGSAIGGFAGGLGVSALGLPGVFILPAGFCLIAATGLFLLHRRMHHLAV